jgi:hypothetical protein
MLIDIARLRNGNIANVLRVVMTGTEGFRFRRGRNTFAHELRQRAEPNKVLYFLRVESRALEFPLRGMELQYRRVFVVPGMILAVIEERENHLIVKWNGPALETDRRNLPDSSYKNKATFVMEIPKSCLLSGDVQTVPDRLVVQMANHVPAVLY